MLNSKEIHPHALPSISLLSPYMADLFPFLFFFGTSVIVNPGFTTRISPRTMLLPLQPERLTWR